MNTDIRIAVGFWHHPKTKRLIREAGLEAVRSLQILWCWSANNRPDGNLSDLDSDDIEDAADWRGERGAFFGAIHDRWLDDIDGQCWLHDWDDHNSWVAEAKERSGKALISKLAQVNPAAFEALKTRNIGCITKDEYAEWKRYSPQSDPNSEPLATAERPQSDPNSEPLATTLRIATAPAPSPAPSLKALAPNGAMSGNGEKPVAPTPATQTAESQPEHRTQIPYRQIVDCLNAATGSHFDPTTKAYQRCIKARWNEGRRLPDFQEVVAIKAQEWGTDPEMVRFLRPETLFGTKMATYLAQGRARASPVAAAYELPPDLEIVP